MTVTVLFTSTKVHDKSLHLNKVHCKYISRHKGYLPNAGRLFVDKANTAACPFRSFDAKTVFHLPV